MSNKEYSKTRKHFKTMYKNGNLTKEVYESKEYLNFEKEENKRKEAKNFVKEYLETFGNSKFFAKLKERINIYLLKYINLLKRKDKLKKELEDLFASKKIDVKSLEKLKRYGLFNKFKIGFIGFAYNAKDFNFVTTDGIFATEKYEKIAKEELFELRKRIILFSNSLIKAEKEMENIKKRIPELIEKRKKEDEKIERENQEKIKQLNREKEIKENSYKTKMKSIFLEHDFLLRDRNNKSFSRNLTR